MTFPQGDRSIMTPLDRALQLCRSGAHSQALEALSALVAEPGQRAAALGHRAWLYRHLGQYEAALQDYDCLLALAPDDLTAAAYRAEVLMFAGRVREAAEACVEILKRDPLHRPAARTLEACQEKLGVGQDERGPSAFTYHHTSSHIDNAAIQALETQEASFPVSVYPGVGRFLYALVKCCRPRLALEVGTYIGYSTLCMAQAMEENGQGHLHSFDLFVDLPDYVSPVAGRCANTLELVRAHLERAGLAHRAMLYPGDSSTRIREEFARCETRADLAFIDGDHTIRGCLKDWVAVDRLIRDGGLVLLHDTEPERCQWLGPRHLLETINRQASGHYQYVNLSTADGCGFAIVQKQASGGRANWRPKLKDLVAERLCHQVLAFRNKSR